jgi:hypothetical protein
MKTIRRKLAAEKRRFQKRLELAKHRITEKPVLDAANIRYELADKVRGIACGGIGAIHKMTRSVDVEV